MFLSYLFLISLPLVVFKEGICTVGCRYQSLTVAFNRIVCSSITQTFMVGFLHMYSLIVTKLTEHIEGVLNRIVQLEAVINMSSG